MGWRTKLNAFRKSLGGPHDSKLLKHLNSVFAMTGLLVLAIAIASCFRSVGYFWLLKPKPNRVYKRSPDGPRYEWVGVKDGWYRHEYGSGDLHPDAFAEEGIQFDWEPYPEPAVLDRPHNAGLASHLGYPLVRADRWLSRQRGYTLHFMVIKIWWCGYSLPCLSLQLLSFPILTTTWSWLARGQQASRKSQPEIRS